MKLTFKKAERLTDKKTFDRLFQSGKSISVSPFRLVWVETRMEELVVRNRKEKEHSNIRTIRVSHNPAFQCVVGISVPKKSFSKAVHRNRLKRRIREAYRKNKHLLYEALEKKNLQIALMIIYTAKEQLPYSEIEQKMIVSLVRITNELRIFK